MSKKICGTCICFDACPDTEGYTYHCKDYSPETYEQMFKAIRVASKLIKRLNQARSEIKVLKQKISDINRVLGD